MIDLVSAIAEVKGWLDRYPGWTANVYPEDEASNIWKVDFCNNQDCDEWLGFGKVNLNTAKYSIILCHGVEQRRVGGWKTKNREISSI